MSAVFHPKKGGEGAWETALGVLVMGERKPKWGLEWNGTEMGNKKINTWHGMAWHGMDGWME